jgi:arginase
MDAHRDSARVLRTYHVLGVPLRAGSLTPGSENDARAFREAELLTRLHTAGVRAVDEGDLAIPSYLPHHTVPPIRNWPAPRIVWDLLGERLTPHLRNRDGVPLLIGCDCSVVVGTARALAHTGADVHVLYVDGDFDDAPPDAQQCRSAAALAVWLLTHGSPFAPDPALRPEQVTVIGASVPSAAHDGHAGTAGARVRALSLADVRRLGPDAAARQALAALPPSAAIVLHFDIDVLAATALPAAYFPHADGLTLEEAAALLRPLAADPRVRVLEVAEYATLADPSRREVGRLIDLLAGALA